MIEDFSGWNDCRFDLPKKDGMLVVVFDPNNHPTVWPAKWNEETQAFDSNGGWFEANEVSHWMPLPEAPKSHAWTDGFKAADKDEEASLSEGYKGEYTHNPHQPTSPYTYPDYHCGPPTLEATDWDAGYFYRQFRHQQGFFRLVITQKIGDQTIEAYL